MAEDDLGATCRNAQGLQQRCDHVTARAVTRHLIQLSDTRPRLELRELAERFGVLPLSIRSLAVIKPSTTRSRVERIDRNALGLH